jgi:hypothetical protein
MHILYSTVKESKLRRQAYKRDQAQEAGIYCKENKLRRQAYKKRASFRCRHLKESKLRMQACSKNKSQRKFVHKRQQLAEWTYTDSNF